MAAIEFEDVTKRFDDGTVAVDRLSLEVDDGEFLILVGPSGCGKTTALRMVVGLEEVTSGEIRIDGRRVNDLPPAERDIAMVFQNYALYPHMTVEQNLAFPLRQQRARKSEIAERVRETASLLSIEELLHRKPRALSGGQRQRVAIGRALVRRPRVFLMDEPLSNLDAKLRVQMRAELISLHRRVGITTVYVTHDQTEAMTLGDRVVVLDRGVVQQVDAPARLYAHPANTFVAGFIGSPAMNFVRGRLDGDSVRVGAQLLELPPAARAALRGDEVVVGVRPEDLVPVNGDGGFAAEVVLVESLGPETLVHVRAAALDVVQRPESEGGAQDAPPELSGLLVARLGPADAAPPATIRLGIAATRARLFDPASGLAL